MSLGYRKLGRNSAQRKALLRDLVTDLIINEKIETTYHKAKEVQKLADKLVTLGKKYQKVAAVEVTPENESEIKGRALAYRVQAAKLVRFEKTEDGQYAIQKLFSVIAPKYAGRNGGYTRVLKTGPRRGDSALMAIIEFVEE